MLFRRSPEKFWNLIASKYAASPIADIEAYQRKIERIRSFLSARDSVLDIGCGTGTQCIDLSTSASHVTGIDISDRLLEIAQTRSAEREIQNVEFIRTTVTDDRLKPVSFDMITAFYVLHFYEDLDAVVGRICDLLKPKGLFVCETACLGDKSRLASRVLRLAGRVGILPFINPLRTRQIELVLERAGLNIVEKTRFGGSKSEYTLIARKHRDQHN